jgi:hypothetical protein
MNFLIAACISVVSASNAGSEVNRAANQEREMNMSKGGTWVNKLHMHLSLIVSSSNNSAGDLKKKLTFLLLLHIHWKN